VQDSRYTEKDVGLNYMRRATFTWRYAFHFNR